MTTSVAVDTDLTVSNLGECRFDSPLAKYIGGRRTNEQDLVPASGQDASGNAKLTNVGVFLRDRITADFAAAGDPLTLKYIDPGYAIR